MSRELAILLAIGTIFVGALLARNDPTGSFSFHPERAGAKPAPSACPPNEGTR